MTTETTYAPIRRIEDLIFLVRGQRVMLDSDLAVVDGVTTSRPNEQVRRNAERFPETFAFQLTAQEFAHLKSQFATSNRGRGGRRKLPWVFTEHGALQLVNVLRSRTAVQASIRVVQAFVAMREQLAAHRELAAKPAEPEARIAGHDEAIRDLFEIIRQLIEPPLSEKRREIGFHVRETAPPYRARVRCRS